GPLLLGRLFDVAGRRVMIAGTYLVSGVLLGVTALLFDHGVLSATTQTVAWVVIFFFASAGASSAYLTVSEIFPMETRALAIAFFYAVGTGIGGIIGPVLFGNLIATKHPGPVALGYLIGGVLMAAGGVVEIVLGVDAEQRPLEEIAAPLSAAEGDASQREAPEGAAASPERQKGPAPIPRRRTTAAAWSPRPTASRYPSHNPFLADEVDALVVALGAGAPRSGADLARAASSPG